MQEAFPGSQLPTEREIENLWINAVFSVDANALLNLYRFRAETRDAMLDIWESLANQGRLWVTYQALLEFHRHRVRVIVDEQQRPEKIVAQFQALVTALNDLVSGGHHPSLDLTAIRNIASEARAEAEKQRKAAKLPAVDPLRDDTLGRLQGIVGNAFGERPGDEEITRLAEVAAARYENRRPPGYSDQGKADGGAGDFLIWNELIEFARRERRGVIFITDDVKEDWWLLPKSKRDRNAFWHPRPELIGEMRHEAGINYYQYTSVRFLEVAKVRLGVEVAQETVEDVREVNEAVQQRERSRGHRDAHRTRSASSLKRLLLPDSGMAHVLRELSGLTAQDLRNAGLIQPDFSQVLQDALRDQNDELYRRALGIYSWPPSDESADDGADESADDGADESADDEG